VGMTGVPEVILARELEIEYGTINLVTNYAAGLQNEITHKEVIELFNKKISVIQKIINKTIEII
jgi:5'-methylthioadenosine phosphorylase